MSVCSDDKKRTFRIQAAWDQRVPVI